MMNKKTTYKGNKKAPPKAKTWAEKQLSKATSNAKTKAAPAAKKAAPTMTKRQEARKTKVLRKTGADGMTGAAVTNKGEAKSYQRKAVKMDATVSAFKRAVNKDKKPAVKTSMKKK